MTEKHINRLNDINVVMSTVLADINRGWTVTVEPVVEPPGDDGQAAVWFRVSTSPKQLTPPVKKPAPTKRRKTPMWTPGQEQP